MAGPQSPGEAGSSQFGRKWPPGPRLWTNTSIGATGTARHLAEPNFEVPRLHGPAWPVRLGTSIPVTLAPVAPMLVQSPALGGPSLKVAVESSPQRREILKIYYGAADELKARNPLMRYT